MLFKNSYYWGLWAEFIARIFLRFRGFRIVKSRYITGKFTRRAEIDIIARRGNLVVFIEVKNRPSVSAAFDAITINQRARLRRAATTWIARNGWRGDARFDVIVVIRGWRVKWFRNAI
ncbi:MAG: YraN family protein [Rickettsiales bacterium]|jgi:putative endonuclease|nr:YraN family protein [Rickettsiales bacterium]